MILTVATPLADILGNPQEPKAISNNDSQLLFGETFEVQDSHGAYVYGQSVVDDYKGYVERDQLIKDAPKTNAVVDVPLAHLYAEPNFKSRPLMPLSYCSRLCLNGTIDGDFSQTADGDWIYTHHTRALSSKPSKTDIVDIALKFLDTPYLFAGRSSLGIDCSGLIQISMMAAGYDAPARDSKDQMSSIGAQVSSQDHIQRGDIVFFEGHVGIMVDQTNILNATARHMSALIEPLADLIDYYKEIKAIKRV